MLSTITTEFSSLFSSSRVNRLRYLSFSGMLFTVFLLICLALGVVIGLLTMFVSFPVDKTIDIAVAPPIFAYLCIKLWIVKRRINDTGRSLLTYLKYIILSIFFFCLPFITSVIPGVNNLITNESALKVLTALSFLIGFAGIIYSWVILLFRKGTATENKYGTVPPANNGLTVTIAILYIVLMGTFSVYNGLQRVNHMKERSMALTATDTSLLAENDDLNIPDPGL